MYFLHKKHFSYYSLGKEFDISYISPGIYYSKLPELLSLLEDQ